MPRFTLHLRTGLLTLALACGTLGALAKEKKATPPPPPPQPMPQKIKVLRDSAIDITLKIYGRKNQAVTYLIRRRPSGKLTAPKQTELEAAVVEYQAPADRSITTDSFEYAARSEQGVSAPALVEIELVDIPAQLIAPLELVFGPVLTGVPEKRTIEIENVGGSGAEGDLIIDGPWRIEVSNHYRIEAGQRRSIAITFVPEKPGDFVAELRYSSQPDRITTLRGKALAALEPRPPILKLEPVTGATVRAAGLVVVNHSTEPQTVKVFASERLIADGPLELQAGQSGTLMIRTSPTDVRPLSEELVLESGDHRTVVPVKAEATPGVLQADSFSIELRAEIPGSPPKGTIVIRNLGGATASADLLADPEFRVSSNKVTLPAGGEVRVDVALGAGIMPPLDGSIQINSGGSSQRVSVFAKGPPRSTPTVTRAGNSRPATKKAVSESKARTVRDEWSPYETDPTAPIDPVNIIRTVAMGPSGCALEWHVDRSSSTKFIAETRELRIENGQLAKHWHAHPAFRVERIGKHFRGTIEKLQPSRMYTIRVRGLDNDGKPTDTVFEASITTRPPASGSSRTGWAVAGIIVAIIVVASGWWRRMRTSSPTPAFDPKKTQRIF